MEAPPSVPASSPTGRNENEVYAGNTNELGSGIKTEKSVESTYWIVAAISSSVLFVTVIQEASSDDGGKVPSDGALSKNHGTDSAEPNAVPAPKAIIVTTTKSFFMCIFHLHSRSRFCKWFSSFNRTTAFLPPTALLSTRDRTPRQSLKGQTFYQSSRPPWPCEIGDCSRSKEIATHFTPQSIIKGRSCQQCCLRAIIPTFDLPRPV